MREHDTDAERELEMLVDALDGVKASDELKGRTLDLLFAELDAQEDAAAAEPAAGLHLVTGGGVEGPNALPVSEGEDDGKREDALAADATKPHFRLVEGGAATTAMSTASMRDETARNDELGQDVPAAVEPMAATSHAARSKTRRRGWWMKVAAIVLALSLATGGVAYAVPVSQVTVSEGDTSIELGINVFGVAVLVSADTESGRELLRDVSVRGSNCEDAMARLLDALALENSSEDIHVSVNGGPDDRRERLEEMAAQASEQRRETAHEAEKTDAEAAPNQSQEGSAQPEGTPSNTDDNQVSGAAGQGNGTHDTSESTAAPDVQPDGGSKPGTDAGAQPTGNEGLSGRQDGAVGGAAPANGGAPDAGSVGGAPQQ